MNVKEKIGWQKGLQNRRREYEDRGAGEERTSAYVSGRNDEEKGRDDAEVINN